MKRKALFIVLSLFFFFNAYFFSQTDFGYLEEPEEEGIFLDYAYFREGGGEDWRIEVYYKIFNNRLTFVKEQDKFKASYEIEMVLFSKNKQFTAKSHEEEYIVDTYPETQSSTGFLINQIDLYAPPGEYKLGFKLQDTNSNQVKKLEQQIILPPHSSNEPVLSGLELARSVKESQDSSRFTKRGKEVIPSVSLYFGDPEEFFWIYFELYNLKSIRAEDYSLIYELEALDKNVVFRDTSKIAPVPLAGEVFYDFKRIVLSETPEGFYTLRLKLLNQKGKERMLAQKELKIEWSLLYQVKNNYTKAVDLLRYVAKDKELKELNSAQEEERVKKWEEFWKSKDPTPDTPENELRDEYYKRVGYANEHFKIYDKEGYKTDMGLVYIKFGPPDEIDRHPFELSTRSYQIWYYYRLNRRFLFVDVSGYGEYELQYPYDGKR